jgi:tetratricopeptide (TPR) repeat protein
VEQTIRAADAAASALAFDHAAVLYQRALDLDVLERAAADAVKVKLAESFAKAGRGVEAASVYLGLAGDGVSNRAVDLRRRAGEQLVCSGHLKEGLRTFDAALAAVGVYRPQTPLAVFLSLLLWKAWIALRGLRFVPRSEDELDPRALLRVDCLASAGPGLGMTDHVRGSAFQVRTLGEALRLGEPARVGRALAFYALALTSAGAPAFARAMEIQGRVEAMARQLKRPYLAGLAFGVTGFAHYLSGLFPKAHEAFERTEAILRDECVGVSYELTTTRLMHFRTLLALGELPAVAGPVTALLNDAERKGDSYTIVTIRTSVTAFLALARDDVAGAREEIERAEAHLPNDRFVVQHVYQLISRAQLALYEGDAARARDEIAQALPAIRRSMLLRVQTIRLRLREAQATALVALGGAAARDAERAILALERERVTWATAQGHLLRGATFAREGARAAALDHFAAAEEGFASASTPLAAAVALRRRGELLGGDEGRSLIATSESRMASAQIRNPERMSALYAPGWPSH